MCWCIYKVEIQVTNTMLPTLFMWKLGSERKKWASTWGYSLVVEYLHIMGKVQSLILGITNKSRVGGGGHCKVTTQRTKVMHIFFFLLVAIRNLTDIGNLSHNQNTGCFMS